MGVALRFWVNEELRQVEDCWVPLLVYCSESMSLAALLMPHFHPLSLFWLFI